MSGFWQRSWRTLTQTLWQTLGVDLGCVRSRLAIERKGNTRQGGWAFCFDFRTARQCSLSLRGRGGVVIEAWVLDEERVRVRGMYNIICYDIFFNIIGKRRDINPRLLLAYLCALVVTPPCSRHAGSSFLLCCLSLSLSRCIYICVCVCV